MFLCNFSVSARPVRVCSLVPLLPFGFVLQVFIGGGHTLGFVKKRPEISSLGRRIGGFRYGIGMNILERVVCFRMRMRMKRARV